MAVSFCLVVIAILAGCCTVVAWAPIHSGTNSVRHPAVVGGAAIQLHSRANDVVGIRRRPIAQRMQMKALQDRGDDDVVQGFASGFDPLGLSSWKGGKVTTLSSGVERMGGGITSAAIAASALVAVPSVASALESPPGPFASALVAYAHYLSLLVLTGATMVERLTIKPKMSVEEEKRMGAADITLGVSGLALAVSGYFRATTYGKGWDFYSHEPIFWLKMGFLGIYGGLSLFPTILIIQRTVKIQRTGSVEPMTEKMAKRMTSILNAELSALVFIPLTATLMSRGVGYVDGFPTEIVGPVLFGVLTAGAVYKYVGDALKWEEDTVAFTKDDSVA